jgi:NADH dehydrogenase (ubiquinone) Fe-S protein 1
LAVLASSEYLNKNFQILKYFNKLQIISNSVSFFSLYELALQSSSLKNSILHYFINSTINNQGFVGKSNFIFYQGHHGDAIAQNSNLLLPAATYLEKTASYVNYLFLVQKTKKVLSKQFFVRADWEILNMVSEVLKLPIKILNYNSLIEKIRVISSLSKFSVYGIVYANKSLLFPTSNFVLNSTTGSYYTSDIISRASKTMALCGIKFKNKASNFFLTNKKLA